MNVPFYPGSSYPHPYHLPRPPFSYSLPLWSSDRQFELWVPFTNPLTVLLAAPFLVRPPSSESSPGSDDGTYWSSKISRSIFLDLDYTLVVSMAHSNELYSPVWSSLALLHLKRSGWPSSLAIKHENFFLENKKRKNTNIFAKTCNCLPFLVTIHWEIWLRTLTRRGRVDT
jgi:hypothetical protein